MADLERICPFLRERGFRVTSPEDDSYNCFAWAAGDTTHWWEPGRRDPSHYWPDGARETATLEAFVAAFATLGYEACLTGEYEPRVEKLALFTYPDGGRDGIPVHAARQIGPSLWTSKLGDFEDIEHVTLDCFENPTHDCGAVACFLRRPV